MSFEEQLEALLKDAPRRRVEFWCANGIKQAFVIEVEGGMDLYEAPGYGATWEEALDRAADSWGKEDQYEYKHDGGCQESDI